MTIQIVKSPSGEEMVLLSKAEYDELVEAWEERQEDLTDVRAYDAAKADAKGSEPLPAEVSQYILKGDGIIKALRLWRGKGQVGLAKELGTSQGFVSDLENRRRKLTPDMAKKLAIVLDVPEHWLPETF